MGYSLFICVCLFSVPSCIISVSSLYTMYSLNNYTVTKQDYIQVWIGMYIAYHLETLMIDKILITIILKH